MQISLPEQFLLENPRIPRTVADSKVTIPYDDFGAKKVRIRIVAKDTLAVTRVYRDLMEMDRLNQFHATRFLEKHGVLEHVMRAVADRPQGAFLPDFYDLAFLYSSIRALKPRRLVELGSGLSTIVMLKALQDNGDGKLQVYEFLEDWMETTRQNIRKLFGESSISSWIDISLHSEKVTDKADLIYLDGCPAKSPFKGGELLHAITGTVVLVDGRYWAVRYIEKHLSPKKIFSVEIELADTEESSSAVCLALLMNACLYF